eukprot:scaffold47_cov334-Pavlova_lutheri.AAC.32
METVPMTDRWAFHALVTPTWPLLRVVAENIADYDLEDLQKLPLDVAQKVVDCLVQRDALVRLSAPCTCLTAGVVRWHEGL